MKIKHLIILLLLALFSCVDRDDYNTEVIAVFTPKKLGDHTDAKLCYKGIIKTTDSLRLAFRPIFPSTFEEGAETIAKLVGGDQQGRKRLIIATDPEYSYYLRDIASKGNIIVLGALLGSVYAGAGGNENAFVMALELDPVQIRIADTIARAPDKVGKALWKREKEQAKEPKIAFRSGDNIFIEPVSRTVLNDIKL